MRILLPPLVITGKTKPCPFCKKALQKTDTECRFCGKELPIDLVECRECGSFVPEKEYCMNCNRKLKI